MTGGEVDGGNCEVEWTGITWFSLSVGCVRCWKSDCGGESDCSVWCDGEVVSGDAMLEWMLRGL